MKTCIPLTKKQLDTLATVLDQLLWDQMNKTEGASPDHEWGKNNLRRMNKICDKVLHAGGEVD